MAMPCKPCSRLTNSCDWLEALPLLDEWLRLACKLLHSVLVVHLMDLGNAVMSALVYLFLFLLVLAVL